MTVEFYLTSWHLKTGTLQLEHSRFVCVRYLLLRLSTASRNTSIAFNSSGTYCFARVLRHGTPQPLRSHRLLFPPSLAPLHSLVNYSCHVSCKINLYPLVFLTSPLHKGKYEYRGQVIDNVLECTCSYLYMYMVYRYWLTADHNMKSRVSQQLYEHP